MRRRKERSDELTRARKLGNKTYSSKERAARSEALVAVANTVLTSQTSPSPVAATITEARRPKNAPNGTSAQTKTASPLRSKVAAVPKKPRGSPSARSPPHHYQVHKQQPSNPSRSKKPFSAPLQDQADDVIIHMLVNDVR